MRQFLLIVSTFVVATALGTEPGWIFTSERLRVPLTAKRVKMDFEKLLQGAGAGAVIEVASLGLAAVDEAGAEKEVPFAFSPADSEVRWQLSGELEVLEARWRLPK